MSAVCEPYALVAFDVWTTPRCWPLTDAELHAGAAAVVVVVVTVVDTVVDTTTAGGVT